MQQSSHVPAGEPEPATVARHPDEGEGQSRSSQALASAGGHTREVATDAAAEARGLAEEAFERLHEQANRQAEQVQQALERSGAQLEALADGRVEDAGPVADYARRAAGKVGEAAERIDSLGLDGIVSEVSDYARRRPGRFLLAAAAAGVVAGRLGRNARSGSRDGPGTGSGSSSELQGGSGQRGRPSGAGQVDLLPEQAPGEAAGAAPSLATGVPPGFGTGPAPAAPGPGEPRHD